MEFPARYALWAPLALGLFACAPAPDASTMPALGSNVASGSVTVEEVSFPLPDGDWNRIWTHRIPGTSPSAPQTFEILVSVQDNVIDRAAVMWVQYKTRVPDRWRRYQGCLEAGDEGVLHSVVRVNTGSDQPSTGTEIDCWHVRAFSLGRQGSPHPVIEALQAFADREGFYLPVTMLSVRFAQRPRTDRRSYADYLWNADLLLPKPDGGIWLPEEWYADRVAESPAMQLVVRRLAEWGAAWRGRLLPGGGTT